MELRRLWFSPGMRFLLLALVWGSSFLFIKVALDGISPTQVALGRLVLGAAVLALVMVVTRRKWPRGHTVWMHFVVIGALFCVLPFLLFAWAGQHIPSGLSSIYNATTPITTLVVSLFVLPEERMTFPKIVGVLVAALGVVVIASPWTLLGDAQRDDFYLSQLACLGATLCYAVGFVYVRRFARGRDLDPVVVAASQICAGAVIMIMLSPFLANTSVDLSPSVVGCMLALGLLGTGIAYIWNMSVLQTSGAAVASTVTFAVPVVGVALGVLVLHERIRWNEPTGASLVILGILVSQGRLGRRQATVRTVPAGPG